MSRLSAKSIRKIGSRALNRAGSQGRTRAGRALAKQTGLKLKTIRTAMVPLRASGTTLEYKIKARGGDIALKHFAARETRKGVSAKPFGARKVFSGTFIKGGKFPGRVALGMSGHVFARDGKSRLPIAKQTSGGHPPARDGAGRKRQGLAIDGRQGLCRAA
ncbi:phage tail protein [Roseibium salinum]|nr:phage tail protein [Roseibium salinum]